MLRNGLIHLSESAAAKKVVTGTPLRAMSRRFVPGETVEDLIGAIFNGGKSGGEESAKAPGGEAGAAHEAQTTGVLNFMQRVYYELRNLGTSAQDRAMNYAATNAFQLKEVFEDAFKEDLQLDRIGVEPSPICRPDSDCWDVKLQFFDPVKIHERARKVYRYTIDVSDVVPVTVGKLRTWYVY